MTNYPVSTGNDDYTSLYTDGVGFTYDYTSSTILAWFSRVVSPYQIRNAIIKCDTSAIPDTDTITAGTFYFYANSYTATKGITKTYNVLMYDGSSYTIIKTGTFTVAGWISEILTSGELAYINKTGTTDFIVSVDDPGNLKARSLTIAAYESGSNIAYLSVTHAPASTYTPQIITVCS